MLYLMFVQRNYKYSITRVCETFHDISIINSISRYYINYSRYIIFTSLIIYHHSHLILHLFKLVVVQRPMEAATLHEIYNYAWVWFVLEYMYMFSCVYIIFVTIPDKLLTHKNLLIPWRPFFSFELYIRGCNNVRQERWNTHIVQGWCLINIQWI